MALDWLARAIEKDISKREETHITSDFDSIRADPRFIALVSDPEPRTGNGGTEEATE